MFGGLFPGKGADRMTQRPDTLRFPALAEMRSYWEALRDGGAPPRRSAIDPRGIAGALEQGFVLERVAPGVARFRIAGMALCDVMGMEVRGMPLLSLIEPPARVDFGRALEGVFAGPSVLEMAMEAERGIGRPALEARLLILPLRDRNGATSLALGCLATDGEVGRAPRRFAIARQMVAPLTPVAQVRETIPGMAEPPAAYTAPARPVPGHPYLRLVKG